VSDAGATSLLMRATTIRARSAAISRHVELGLSQWWTVDLSRLDEAARSVAALTRERFPTLNIPFHSRWRHFEAGGIGRPAQLSGMLSKEGKPPGSLDALRAQIDLCVVSVLLDAGAGPSWSFTDQSGLRLQRSEGLGVASLEAFVRGAFSDGGHDKLRASAKSLAALQSGALAKIFQHDNDNLLEGLDGRLALLNRLGQTLVDQGASRVSDIYEPLLLPAQSHLARGRTSLPAITAKALLETTINALAPVWLKASTAPDGARGDLWAHAAACDPSLNSADPTQGWVPFHKLSQWLCYSLIEPFREAGYAIESLESLTGLPEYRNGGLLVDAGVIQLRDPTYSTHRWTPEATLVVEWRALTVTLIDALAERIRQQLGGDETSLPLACLLEGGTWAAGRRYAEKLRGGRPPLEVDTAGTVF
jgi:hypothetical protein